MIPVTLPIQAIHGTCAVCKGRAWQVLIENTIEGKYTRMWLKVDAIHASGDGSDEVCGYTEHACRVEAA